MASNNTRIWIRRAMMPGVKFLYPVESRLRCGPACATHCCVLLALDSEQYAAPRQLPAPAEGEADTRLAYPVHAAEEYLTVANCALDAAGQHKCPFRDANQSGSHDAIKVRGRVQREALEDIKYVGYYVTREYDRLNGMPARDLRARNRLDVLRKVKERIQGLRALFEDAKVIPDDRPDTPSPEPEEVDWNPVDADEIDELYPSD